jgi:hypothetical protein
MARLLISEEKITGLASVIFILSLGTLFYLDYPNVWEMLMIAGGIMAMVRQFLLGRLFGLLLAFVLFGGAWAAIYFDFYVDLAIPILAAIGALYILLVQIGRYYQRSTPKVEVKYPEEPLATPEEPDSK